MVEPTSPIVPRDEDSGRLNDICITVGMTCPLNPQGGSYDIGTL
jgi:hypothetical protein